MKRNCNGNAKSMKENDVREDVTKGTNGRSSGRQERNGKRNRRQAKPKLEERSNNPAWYYLDAKIADQVSQLSFQNLAGFPIKYDGKDFDVPNIVRIALNPAPGVQTSSQYNSALSQHSAINMAGFKLYSRLSAFTGRTQSYAPQDVSTMLLAFGEIISISEFIRRSFGVAYTTNMRNRDYPRQVLEFGMCIDSTDMFANLADYRTRFNTLMTLINQLPIPKNIAYFDKCASLYEKIFLDAPSSMAQTLVPVPYSTWLLDETSYVGGSVLKTTQFMPNPATRQNLSVYLNLLDTMIVTLLNSSSLSVIYTDILNYASKFNVEFWKMDYLMEDYHVFPEYDANFLLQMHNATICSYPVESNFVTTPDVVTPLNDVYPDANNNCIFYNPAFPRTGGTVLHARTGRDVLIDMLNDQPTLTDRVEVTRYSSITDGKLYTATGNVDCCIDTTLPDHYIVRVEFEAQTSNLTFYYAASTVVNSNQFPDVAALVANIDWAPRFWEVNSTTGAYTGRYTGDVNFYTVVDEHYLRKLHDFVGLALYDFR